MLRPVRHSHIKSRLIAAEVDYSSGTPAVTAGCKSDYTSVTDNGAGDASLNLKEPYHRVPIAVVTPFAGTGSIGNVTGATISAIRAVVNDSAGSPADGKAHSLIVGYDSPTLIKAPGAYGSHLKTTRYKSKLTAFSVESAALVEGKFRATLAVDTAQYSLTPKNPGGSVPIVVGAVRGTTAGVVNIVSSAATSVVVKTFDAAGSESAKDCNLLVLSKDGSFELGRNKAVVDCPQKDPIFFAFKITVTGGTPTLAIGGEDATLADDGAGIYTITFNKPFKRAPIFVPCADGSYIATAASSSTTAIQVRTFTNAGVAADAGVVYVIGLAHNTVEQY